MDYEELIDKLGAISDKNGWLLTAVDGWVGVHAEFFYHDHLNKFQNWLNRYAECAYWVYPSGTLANSVELRIQILKYKD